MATGKLTMPTSTTLHRAALLRKVSVVNQSGWCGAMGSLSNMGANDLVLSLSSDN